MSDAVEKFAERWDAATPGPWREVQHPFEALSYLANVQAEGATVALCHNLVGQRNRANAEAIAMSRNVSPAFVKLLRALDKVEHFNESTDAAGWETDYSHDPDACPVCEALAEFNRAMEEQP